MGYTRNPQTIPDDTPGGSTVRQGVKDQNSQAVDDLFVSINAHSNNEDGRSHVEIDAALDNIVDPVTGIVPRAEAARDEAEQSSTAAAASAVEAATSATEAASSALEAKDAEDAAKEAASFAVHKILSLEGPKAVPEGNTVTYFITNYSDFLEYVVSVDFGVATISGDTITFTAGNYDDSDKTTMTVSLDGFPVVPFEITIQEKRVATPVILSPTEGETDVSVNLTVTTDAYQVVGFTPDQSFLRVRVWGDAAKTNLISDTGEDTVNLTSVTIAGLSPDTDLYIEAQKGDKDASIPDSEWSELRHCKTTLASVDTPTGVSPSQEEELGSPDGLTLVGSAFATSGASDTHQFSQWQIYTDNTLATLVYDSGTVSDLTSHVVPDGTIGRGESYSWRVRYNGASLGWSNYSSPIDFSVKNIGNGVRVDGGIAVGPYNFADGQTGYLIVAPASQRTASIKWGLYDTDVSGIDNISSASTYDTHTGAQNTAILVSSSYNSINDGQGSVGSPAANLCNNLTFEGMSDYFLPNKEELAAIIAQKNAVDAADDTTGSKFSNIGTGYILSSSEYNRADAWYQRSSDGSQVFFHKYLKDWVVPCRRLIL